MAEADHRLSVRVSFWKGFRAGLLVLIVWLIVRLGGLAPFPPESALVSFFSIIPESIQEPAVQGLGEAAGLVGLAVAILLASAVYGLLAVLFERQLRSRASKLPGLSRFERALLYALVPWFIFNIMVFPLSGISFFGLGSNIASTSLTYVFPLTTLFLQLLWSLLLWGRPPLSETSVPGPGPSPPLAIEPRDVNRRTFIERGLVLVGSAILIIASVGSAAGALISEGGILSEGAPSILPGSPINTGSAPAIFGDPRLVALVDSEVTNNDSFYRVAIDIFDPSVPASEWSLALDGLVANPKSYSLADLQNLPKVQQYTTFICVSNVVNGGLISNARWGGVRLSDLFADAGGISSGAKYVVFHSVDGYTVGIPVSKALEPESMLAYEMNGVALPQRHGYPIRAVIPGIYGMMSAKWVREVELSDTVYLGYWQTRGWSNDATVQTASFVRVPEDGASVSLSQNGGSVMIGGVAYAGDRGISKVEVSTDGGRTWQQATLKPPASELSWVLWAFEWFPSSPGQYSIYVRAADGSSQLQTADRVDSYPSGATGYAMSTLNVVS